MYLELMKIKNLNKNKFILFQALLYLYNFCFVFYGKSANMMYYYILGGGTLISPLIKTSVDNTAT
jgi:hypothetical protein